MPEVNLKDVLYNWYVMILINIWVLLTRMMTIFAWTGLYPEYDFDKYGLILTIITFSLIVAGTVSSLIFRGVAKLSRFIGRKLRGE